MLEDKVRRTMEEQERRRQVPNLPASRPTRLVNEPSSLVNEPSSLANLPLGRGTTPSRCRASTYPGVPASLYHSHQFTPFASHGRSGLSRHL